MLLRNVPLLLPYLPYSNNDNDLPRCSNPNSNHCLKHSTDRVVRFMCECSKQFYCSEMCREQCHKDHYIFCNQILTTKKNQQKSIVSSKKPLNAKASNVDPFITVSETWITSLSDLWSLGEHQYHHDNYLTLTLTNTTTTTI
jgi:hypothetical protein